MSKCFFTLIIRLLNVTRRITRVNATYFYIDIIRESSVSKSDMSCAFLHFVFDYVLHIIDRSRVFYSFDKRSRSGAFWRVSVMLRNDFVERAFFVSSIFLLFLDMNSINWSLKRASFYLYSHFYSMDQLKV